MIVHEERLKALMDAFLAENAKLNLSAFRAPEHCWTGNILDSVAFLQAFDTFPDLKKVTSLLDIGTGGGFPLMPLAMCLPEVKCVGMDATQKKIDAVQRIVDAVKIPNVSLLSGRMETFAHSGEYRGQFDLVTARAVAPLAVILEYAVPFLKVGGIAAFWKSSKYADELAMSANAQKILSSPFLGRFDYSLGEEWGDRTIVMFKKTGPTSNDYPRRTGIPKQKPL